MNVLLNKAWEQLNTQELDILKDIITQKRLALEQDHVPSLRELAHEALKEAEVLKEAEALKEAQKQAYFLFSTKQSLAGVYSCIIQGMSFLMQVGKVDSQKLQKAVDDLVEDLDSWRQEKLSEADQYISQEKDAIEFAQTHFSQLQERWRDRWEDRFRDIQELAKQKYAQEYLAQAVSEKAHMLKGQGVSQQALLHREPPLVVSQPDLADEVISDTRL